MTDTTTTTRPPVTVPRTFTYRVRTIHEETDCHQCGTPLYVGDTVHTQDRDHFGDPFCSRRCSWVSTQRGQRCGGWTQ